MSRKSFINGKDKIKSSQFSYTDIVITRKIKFLAVVTPPPDIYHGCSTWKIFWLEKFTTMNMTSCVRCNFSKHREINNSKQCITM